MTDRQAILVNSDLFFENDPSKHLPRDSVQSMNTSWKKLVNRRNVPEDITQNWVMLTERIEKRSRGEVKIH